MPFDHAKDVRKSKLGPGLLTYYKNPVYIWKVGFCCVVILWDVEIITCVTVQSQFVDPLLSRQL